MKPALLVIDVQNEFFKSSPITAQSLTDALEYINAAIAIFREKKLPVICVQDQEGDRVPGTENFDLPASLDILPTDVHIVKTYSNAFNKTPLAEILKDLDADTVILTGYCAEYCVLSTCRGAADLDFTPVLLRNSLASGKPENIRFVESISEVISYGALKKMMEG